MRTVLVGIGFLKAEEAMLDNGNGRRGRAARVIGGDALLNIFTKLRTIYNDPYQQPLGEPQAGGGPDRQPDQRGTCPVQQDQLARDNPWILFFKEVAAYMPGP
jgi:hypothetical protein